MRPDEYLTCGKDSTSHEDRRVPQMRQEEYLTCGKDIISHEASTELRMRPEQMFPSIFVFTIHCLPKY